MKSGVPWASVQPPTPFYKRLHAYYSEVGKVLRGEAIAAGIFANTTDIGMSRERTYAEFLRHHLPPACNVLFGGFLFGITGQESQQLDVIVTTDGCPQYNFFSREWGGKSFSCIDGTAAVVSIKSKLDTRELHQALGNIASLPLKSPLTPEMLDPAIVFPEYDDLPYKIVYAPDGMSLDSIERELLEFYEDGAIEPAKRPNLIHVANKYWLMRNDSLVRALPDGAEVPPHAFVSQYDPSDAVPLCRAVVEIQNALTAIRHIVFSYADMLNYLPMPNFSLTHTLANDTDFFTAEPASDDPASDGKLEKGTVVALLHKVGKHACIRTTDGRVVHVRSDSLRALQREATSDD